jgi:hypothetical protein
VLAGEVRSEITIEVIALLGFDKSILEISADCE